MRKPMLSRRQLLRTFGGAALALPFFSLLHGQKARASGAAKRVIFFYFPDGVAGQSQNGDPSLWHATGSEKAFQLTQLLDPLTQYKDDCVFLNGLSMGGTDSGSHPGGAKKLLTATDGGNGTSIDQALAGTFGAQAPFRHLYLGAMANQDNASGDKHISYPSPGQSLPPTDDPRQAFDMLFGHAMGGPMMGGKPDPVKVSVIDGVLADMKRLQGDLGSVEKQKLDVHLDALREVEKRIKNVQMPSASCDKPSIDTSTINDQNLEDSARFPDILKAQIDLMVLAMSCGLTDVGTIQASHHTSDLVMSRFPNTEMYDPNFDMRSHQASHYGAAHDFQKKEFKAFVAQIRWWVSQFAYLVGALKAQPEGGGTMLDNTLLLLCSEICDGNTHLHDNMPFVLAGRAGGALQTGRLLDYSGQRHANLLLSIAHATGQMWPSFGDASSGGLSGLL